MPNHDRLERRRAIRESLPRILIVCEGTKTEPSYFKHLGQFFRIPIEVLPAGGVPKTVVEKAVTRKREAERESKRRRDASLKFDEVWCVFDIDEHPNVPNATNQARDNLIEVAISNPCFELWILLHFQPQTAYIARHNLRQLCRQHLPEYEKSVPCDRLSPMRETAVRNALALERRQIENGCAGNNPFTGVHHLVERLRSLSRER